MTSPAPALPVLIVGAGPTGLVLALCLARHGVPLRIVERNSGPGQASRAMGVQARTLEFYQQLGFAEQVVELGIRVRTAHVYDGGQEVARMELGDAGAGLSPYPFVLVFPQDDHERFLVGKLQAAGVEIEWNTALESFTQNERQVTATLRRDGNAERVDCAYLCGCDGARSLVREGLKLEFSGGTYQHLYYVADVELDGPSNRDLHLHVESQSFALMLPVRSSGSQRLIGVMPDTDSGKGEPHSFNEVGAGAQAMLGIQVKKVNWFSTYSAHHRVASAFRKGRCFIAGDAGHIHSPVGAQGMNTGIGDAVNLSWKLAQVLQGRAAPALLDTYQAERITFARELVATTDRVFQAIVTQGLGGMLLRRWVVPHVLPVLAGYAALRRKAFEAVSQIRIHYDHSALSGGHAGKVRGGDRMPWVTDGAQDNFAALRSMDWQLHVYGAASPQLTSFADSVGLALHLYAWDEAADAAGLLRDAAYLLRPDGYVALAVPSGEYEPIQHYIEQLGLRFAAAA